MNRFSAFLLLCLLAFSFSCSPRKGNEKTAAPEVSFRCETQIEETTEIPRSQVFVTVNGQEQKVADILACDLIDASGYENFEIPKSALAACGGWWAGAGDYLYAVVKGSDVVIMKGWQSEEQTESGFHYEEVLRVPVK
ncbi:MAG: hypothetical protein KBG02_16230 [Haliscomenobacter sp.]|nr:hypothetical protein [Haliscomenobacter sp.]MBK8654727.1 hypothetical protein [Haliscomenobacter sp.]MBP9078418.1 hypothetical protein [Haliscomenobacter sp.]